MTTVELATQFLRYCEEHPQQRFWQALRNWTGYQFIYVQLNDSFYFSDEWVLID